MFDLGTTKLLLLGIIALLVVGPKELPGMLRTIGRYVGMMKRQAAEFRTQFDDAMKESEFAELKKQVEDIGREAHSAVKEAETTLTREVDAVQAEANKTLAAIDADTNAMAAEVQATVHTEAHPAIGSNEVAPAAHPEPTHSEPAHYSAPAHRETTATPHAGASEVTKTPERAGA